MEIAEFDFIGNFSIRSRRLRPIDFFAMVFDLKVFKIAELIFCSNPSDVPSYRVQRRRSNNSFSRLYSICPVEWESEGIGLIQKWAPKSSLATLENFFNPKPLFKKLHYLVSPLFGSTQGDWIENFPRNRIQQPQKPFNRLLTQILFARPSFPSPLSQIVESYYFILNRRRQISYWKRGVQIFKTFRGREKLFFQVKSPCSVYFPHKNSRWLVVRVPPIHSTWNFAGFFFMLLKQIQEENLKKFKTKKKKKRQE